MRHFLGRPLYARTLNTVAGGKLGGGSSRVYIGRPQEPGLGVQAEEEEGALFWLTPQRPVSPAQLLSGPPPRGAAPSPRSRASLSPVPRARSPHGPRLLLLTVTGRW